MLPFFLLQYSLDLVYLGLGVFVAGWIGTFFYFKLNWHDNQICLPENCSSFLLTADH